MNTTSVHVTNALLEGGIASAKISGVGLAVTALGLFGTRQTAIALRELQDREGDCLSWKQTALKVALVVSIITTFAGIATTVVGVAGATMITTEWAVQLLGGSAHPMALLGVISGVGGFMGSLLFGGKSFSWSITPLLAS